MTPRRAAPARFPLIALALALAACADPPGAVDSLPADATGRTAALAASRDLLADLDGLAAEGMATEGMAGTGGATGFPAPAIAALRGRGFSQVAGQPGGTLGERRLLAIRAARVEALRDLTEQVHGLALQGTTTLGHGAVVQDAVTARVEGMMRGARTVAITPRGDDGYEVVMELQPDTLAYMLRALRAGA
ncbi:LPP20 family lipoprotein [Frigidibacter oleivorans]|uniref:LPP20 family lipoprotein n=1 Tax=Frigidibacter oleivorans TaxID=2487129 RepID=UPI000F8F80C2|nr:LPP20 family lipoprotein [Frigidibacter oleivorans]